MESLNRMAVELVDEAIDFADELGVAVHHLDDDAVVLDFGVDTDAGVEAGLLLAEIATGGLATVQTRVDEVAGAPLGHVELSTDHPLLALLCSGKAGWEFPAIDGVGSGPARLFAADGEEFASLDHDEEFDFAVLAVEAATLPDEDVSREVAAHAGVPTSGVFLPTAPAGSIAGSVALAARAAEVAVFRLMHLGYDPGDVLAATGSAPVPPIPADETTAVARANDAIAHGGRVHLVVAEDFDAFDEVPFAATGMDSFAGRIDERRDLAGFEDDFAPAAVTIDVRGGPTYVEGTVDEGRLADSLGL